MAGFEMVKPKNPPAGPEGLIRPFRALVEHEAGEVRDPAVMFIAGISVGAVGAFLTC
jgi:hypothetical protein